MGNLSEEFTDNLVKDKEIRSSLRVRSRSFVTKTADKRYFNQDDSWLLKDEGKLKRVGPDEGRQW
jgi:hypothetical protein